MHPTDVLPHRPPFLFVDDILEVVPGRSARGQWLLTGNEPFFQGHFPGRPILPGVLMIEAMAQLAGIAVLARKEVTDRVLLFGGIDKARFRRLVVPGDTLTLEVELDRVGSGAGRGGGRAWVGGGLACEARMFFVVAPAER